MLALSLLKKEYELSKLQQKIGKEVCQRYNPVLYSDSITAL